MHSTKSLAYALFFVFLCIAPIFAYAQDDIVARLIDLPNVENDDKKLSMTKALTEALSNAGHVVFSEDEMNAVASTINASNMYWLDGNEIAKVNEKIRHDAVVRAVHHKKGRKGQVIIYVYNAYTGEVVELEKNIKKAGKLSSSDIKSITRGINKELQKIVPIEYKTEIVITITSTPTGATVTRNGITLGTTPFEYKTEAIDGASEQWVITYEDREPVTQLIAMDKTQSYDVNIVQTLASPERLGKVAGSHGRPIFGVGFNTSPTIRDLDSSAKQGTPTAYTSQAFPTFSFDLELFPFALGLENDYLQGLGLQASVGFAFLSSKLMARDEGTECQKNVDGTFTCDTSYVRFNADIVYRLLLQKDGEKLDPDGMALDFLLGINLARYTIARNTTYSGHDYTGAKLGLRFHTPLGFPEFRLQAGLNFYINGGHGDIEKTTKWGTRIDSSWGTNATLNLLYDVYKGIYLRAGYSFTYMGTDFGGIGCVDSLCKGPIDTESDDMYHEIMLGIGYMLY